MRETAGSGVSGRDPDFWEVPVPPELLDAREGSLVDAFSSPTREGSKRDEWKRRAARELRVLIASGLTQRQQKIVELYFFQARTQVEIAAELGISQQAVSRQLFGVLRNGRRVGGAIRRLRTLCERAGLDPDEWV
jgi:DNA-directed RNA polymerase specialized sigma24 family protein